MVLSPPVTPSSDGMCEISWESSEDPEESSSPLTGVDARLGSATFEEEDVEEVDETFL